ncbi:hypothetical protein AOLI_G00319810 [Acnodon oligacanthus]
METLSSEVPRFASDRYLTPRNAAPALRPVSPSLRKESVSEYLSPSALLSQALPPESERSPSDRQKVDELPRRHVRKFLQKTSTDLKQRAGEDSAEEPVREELASALREQVDIGLTPHALQDAL